MSFTAHQNKRIRVATVNELPSKTEQSHKDACDIHTIVDRAKRMGFVEHIAPYEGKYLDMPSGTDLLANMLVVREAEEMWQQIPSKVRNRFENDPAQFLDFMQDPRNYDEIGKLGFDNSYIPEAQRPKAPQAAPEASGETKVSPEGSGTPTD
jgi:phage internal scaffolding protein